MSIEIIVCFNTFDCSNKLHHVDNSFDAVAGGIDHDDDNEDSGNIDISARSLVGMRKHKRFLLDGFVDEDIENNEENERKEAEEDRNNSGDLKKLMLS